VSRWSSRRQRVTTGREVLGRLATFRAIDVLRRANVDRPKRRPSECESMVSAASSRNAQPRPGIGGEVREALAQLPGEQSVVFCLRHLNDLSYEEIAGQLGFPRMR